ncbi:MAG: tRNA lysidine(34) synthetase TilS [Gammaproteobacteria bacterium RIFCSPLOWO2_02_FULL_61_13]|nr:MAG: tRNA lysidine(34) synthetase TilS [Gammaproteobacteria bacterium RIFCSPLOWO2_02_FULL_61_13]
MESSRNSPPADLVAHVAAQLRESIFPGAHLVLGLSGGMDSVSLLHILAELSGPLRFSLRAVHINHGISPRAADWARFCQRLCAQLGTPLAVEAVDISSFRHLGPEAAARAARWSALRRHQADFLVLAQHRDDQAETLLLQLLRGAGPAGLSGMAPSVFFSDSLRGQVRVLRPMLDLSRAEVEAFIRSRGYQWVEDESNANVALDRNFLRHQVLPAIMNRHAHATRALSRSAGLLAEAAVLLEELGRQDIALLEKDGALDLPGLRALGDARARNALRAYCNQRGIPVPGYSRIREIWKQIREPRKDSNLCIEWDGYALRRYRARIFIEKHRAAKCQDLDLAPWNGEPCMPLMPLHGLLNFRPEEGKGISLDKLRSAPVTVRLRRGGERLQIDPRRPRRTLKNLWQEHGVPPWLRDRQPLLYCGEQLVCVPGLGEDYQWRAAPGERGLIVSWQQFG